MVTTRRPRSHTAAAVLERTPWVNADHCACANSGEYRQVYAIANAYGAPRSVTSTQLAPYVLLLLDFFHAAGVLSAMGRLSSLDHIR
jgi:hypothetical protein